MQGHTQHRLENLAGAFTVALSDRISSAAESVVGMGGEAPAAIVQIGTTPNLTITMLGLALGLTHSATVRVVAKLEASKLVRKVRGEDAREVCVSLTASGERMMRKILAAREQIITRVMKPLSSDERMQFERMLETLLRRVPGDEDEAIRICRMCDEGACPQDCCPVTTVD